MWCENSIASKHSQGFPFSLWGCNSQKQNSYTNVSWVFSGHISMSVHLNTSFFSYSSPQHKVVRLVCSTWGVVGGCLVKNALETNCFVAVLKWIFVVIYLHNILYANVLYYWTTAQDPFSTSIDWRLFFGLDQVWQLIHWSAYLNFLLPVIKEVTGFKWKNPSCNLVKFKAYTVISLIW